MKQSTRSIVNKCRGKVESGEWPKWKHLEDTISFTKEEIRLSKGNWFKRLFRGFIRLIKALWTGCIATGCDNNNVEEFMREK